VKKFEFFFFQKFILFNFIGWRRWSIE
jgi:hypothetical protein